MACGLALVLGAGRASAQELDWCAPIVVRPDQRFYATSTCEEWWKRDTIAAEADIVFGGFNVPDTTTIAPPTFTCFGPQTQTASRAYHDDLRSRASGLGRTLEIVLATRFDIVNRFEAASPGFDPAFLVPAAVPLDEASAFFALDKTPICRCGCSWSEEPGPAGAAPGESLREIVDGAGAPGSYQAAVQYGIRPSSQGTLEGDPRVFYGSAALADQGHAGYRAWKIALVEATRVAGGFDVVELNHKFHQYQPNEDPHWWGGPKAPTVKGYLSANDTLWSAEPEGYGYLEYLAGWSALAADLTSAGVPYSVNLSPFVWVDAGVFDDPSTPAIDESHVIRSVAEGATLVLLQRRPQFDESEIAAIVAEVEAAGSARVVLIDVACGIGGPDDPQTPQPELRAKVTFTPDVGTNTYAGQRIEVVPSGPAAGAWDADLWCDCASPPCGTPDAQVASLSDSSWLAPESVCDALLTSAPGSYRPRVEIRRAGFVAQGTERVTICTPACGNGRDDDGDGLSDHPADPGCATADSVVEHPACDDGLDNDGDGRTDYSGPTPDPDCESASWGRESSCGLGFELAPALLALGWLRRRRLERPVR